MTQMHPWRQWGVCLTAVAGMMAAAGAARMDPPAEPPGTAPETKPEAKPGTKPEAPGVKPTPAPLKVVEPEVVLHLVDGRRFSGFLVEKNAAEFIIRIAGIKTPFKAEEVARYQVLPPVLERYQELRKAVDERDVDQMLRLCDWLSERGELDLALEEVNALIRRVPESTTAVRAKARLLARIDLRDKARTRPIDGATPGEGEPGTAPRPEVEAQQAGAFEPFPYLSTDEVNLMKVYEVDLAKPPRIDVPRDVIDELLQKHSGHPAIPVSREGREAIYRLPEREKLELLFRVRAKGLYARVKIIDQPESMRLFRDEVQRTWLIPSCATNACHGGADAGRLVLTNRRPASDASMYTNFYILQNFKLADGTPLLDFNEPERSALLEMGMAREDVRHRHPPVMRGSGEGGSRDVWKPIIRSRDDQRYKQAVNWLKALYRPRPEYGIRYMPARGFEAGKSGEDPGR